MRKLEDRVLIVGILLSLGITAVLWALKQDALNTILIGLSTTAVTFLMEITIRLRGQHAETTKLLNFSEQLNQDDWIAAKIRAIADNYFKVLKEINDPLFRSRVQDIIQEANDETAMLASGRLMLSADEDASYSLKVWERAMNKGDTIIAVSYNKNCEWWRHDTQKPYFQRNLHLAKQGVVIRRVFVLQRKDVEGMKEVASEMTKAGIECFIAIEEEIPSKFVGGYVIVNNKIAKTWRTTATGREQGGEIVVNATIISSLERDFEQLILYSRPVSEIFESNQQKTA